MIKLLWAVGKLVLLFPTFLPLCLLPLIPTIWLPIAVIPIFIITFACVSVEFRCILLPRLVVVIMYCR